MIQKASATEFVMVPVFGKEGPLQVDPTADAVEMAFMVNGDEPVPGDYVTAAWETDDSTTPVHYFARCRVGPLATTLAVGRYAVWVKWTDGAEVPVREAGVLQIV